MTRTVRNPRYSDDEQTKRNYKPPQPMRQSSVGTSVRRINSELIDPDLTPDDGDERRSSPLTLGHDPANIEHTRTPNSGQNIPFGDNLEGGIEEHEQADGRTAMFREKDRSGVFPAPSVADQVSELEPADDAPDHPSHRRRDPLRAAALQKKRAEESL